MENNLSLELKNISKTFPGVKALSGVSFSAVPGKVCGLVGVNGAGKSTLMNILGGIHQPDEGGDILISGEKVVIENPKSATDHGIAFIQQEVQAFDTMSVYENILASDLNKWRKKNSFILDRAAMKKEAQKYLDTLDSPIDVDAPVYSLTVGDKQIIQIARALSQGGKILLFDEPTASLSDHETAKLFEIIKRLKAQGHIVFYISHFLDEIFELCDHVVILRDGQVVGKAEIGDINKEKLVEMMLGYQIEGSAHTRSGSIGEVIFKAEHITGEKLPKDFSFELHRGEILGVWGLLGSGRSELFNTVLGIDRMVDGKLWFRQNGELSEISQKDFYRHIGYLTEGRHYDGLFLNMSIGQNITSSNLEQFASKGLGILNTAKEHVEARRLMKDVNVKAIDENMKVSKLSGGNQQKVIIAKWFLKNPEILFMDEPTKGVDVGAKNEIKDLIFQKAENGTSFVIVSSELEEIMSLCDRIIVIYEGRLVGEVEKEDFSKENLMRGIVSQEGKNEEK
ncbi:sugar ABC transporter ATP-binding protein [[Clostridium] aminophilum]|uniref:sugar ABC transporter ATP-binding protein n=1 Tax=[Clostridium] aminophilum TaxID=1526 RepID=UPI00332B4277